MNRNIKKFTCIFAAVLCMAAFFIPAYAVDGYYASDETGTQVPPASIDSITVSTENVNLPEKQDETPLTPDGNMTLIDDILQSEHFASVETTETVANKQFITIQSKNGNYFYLVIDRSGDTENVYFLNLVDEADLLALMEDGSTEEVPDTCICADKCVIGSINTGCPICRTAMSDCVGKEVVKEPEPTPEPDTDVDTDKPADTKQSNSSLLLVVLIVVLGGGFAVYWFKFRDKTPKNKGGDDLDDYNFGQNEDEEEETEIDDAELMAEVNENNENEENN